MNEETGDCDPQPCRDAVADAETAATVASQGAPLLPPEAPLTAGAVTAPHPGDILRGRVLMILSAAGFAFMALLIKLIPPAISSHEKVFFRSFVGLVVLVAWLAARGIRPGRPRNVRGLAWRGIFGAAALLLFFYSIDTTGLTKAILYSYTYPLFAALFAWFDLHEKPGRAGMLALAGAVAGTVLTLDMHGMRPQLTPGELAGLMSGVLSGAAVTSVRRLRRTDSSIWIVIAFLAASTVSAIPFMVGRFTMPDPFSLALLLMVAVVAMVSQVAMTRAYKHLSAVEGSVLSLGAVPISAVLAMIVLGETLPPRFWFGAALVLGATALLCARVSETPAPVRADAGTTAPAREAA